MKSRLQSGALAVFHLVVFACIGLGPHTVEAQTYSVEGFVTDRSGSAVGGANVIIQGTLFGTVTSSDGRFAFERVRSNTYTIQVLHSEYAEYTDEIVVNSDTDLQIELLPNLADLTLTSLDNSASILDEWIAESGSTGNLYPDRISLAAGALPAFDKSMSGLPGVFHMTHDLSGGDLQNHASSVAAQRLRPRHPSGSADVFDQREVWPTSFSAGVIGNAGGPMVASTVARGNDRTRVFADGHAVTFTQDYRAGNSVSTSAFGERQHGAIDLVRRLANTSAVHASASISRGNDIPYPRLNARLSSDRYRRAALTFRSAPSEVVNFVDVSAAVADEETSFEVVNDGSGVYSEVNTFEYSAVELNLRAGLLQLASLEVRGLLSTAMSNRTLIGSPEAIQALPEVDHRVVGAKVDVPGRKGDYSLVASGSVASATFDGEDLASESFLEAGTSVSVTGPLSSRSRFFFSTSLARTAPPRELIYSTGLWTSIGQSVGKLQGVPLNASRQFSMQTRVIYSASLARLEVEGSVRRIEDGYTVSVLNDDNGVPVFGASTADLTLGQISGKAGLSLREIVLLDITGLLVFGRNRSVTEPAAGIPSHRVGTDLLIRTPAGGTYVRSSSTLFLSKNNVSHRLGEAESPSAFVIDTGIGYTSGELSVEAVIENVFNVNYFHHTEAAVDRGSRLPALGRLAGVRVTVTPGRDSN